MDLQKLCDRKYNTFYKRYVDELIAKSRKKTISDAIERNAQRQAIKDTYVSVIKSKPVENRTEIWRDIQISHVKRKVGTDTKIAITPEVIQRVISADQSWRKSSGHAFESYICDVLDPQLERENMEIRLQSYVSKLLKNNALKNKSEQIEWLKKWVKKDVFDLYVIQKDRKSSVVIGCVQAKTSIRDRVSRDVEPSRTAMDMGFWSIAITLDGRFLQMEKFNAMVNGVSTPTLRDEQNGWHAMYGISDTPNNDRIYCVDDKLTLVANHAIKLANERISSTEMDYRYRSKP